VGKSKRGSKEFTREQRLLHENMQLKRKVAQLRKELARLDLDRYENIKEAMEEHFPEQAADNTKLLASIRQAWACKMPNCTGTLEIFLYSKMGNLWYYRLCDAPGCKNRTKAQKYSPEVKGPIKGSKDE
jgi:hypothetical protein